METARVLITDIPGPTWWEFLMQWGLLFTQAAAAIGTLAAVAVALRFARRDAEWRRETEAREQDIINTIIDMEIGGVRACLSVLMSAVGAVDEIEDGTPYSPKIAGYLAGAAEQCSIESCWKIVDKLPWLSEQRRTAVARIMGRVPDLKRICARLHEWPDDRPGRQEYAVSTWWVVKAVHDDCVRHFP